MTQVRFDVIDIETGASHSISQEEWGVMMAAFDLRDALHDLVERDRAEAAESGFTDDEMTWLEDGCRALAKARQTVEA